MEIVFQFSCLQRRKLETVEGFCDYATTSLLKKSFILCTMCPSFQKMCWKCDFFLINGRNIEHSSTNILIEEVVGLCKELFWCFKGRRVEISASQDCAGQISWGQAFVVRKKKSPRNSSAKDRQMQMCPAQFSTRRQLGDETYLTLRNGHFMTFISDFQFPIIKFWCSQEPGRVA